MTEQALRKETTSHPYIAINKDVCGGSPIIEGTRTRVMDIAIEYELLDRSPDEYIPSKPLTGFGFFSCFESILN